MRNHANNGLNIFINILVVVFLCIYLLVFLCSCALLSVPAPTKPRRILCMLNLGLEWDKRVSNELIHSRQWSNRHLFHGRRRSLSLAYTLSLVWSCLSAPVELSTRYTTADIVAEIGSTSTTVE